MFSTTYVDVATRETLQTLLVQTQQYYVIKPFAQTMAYHKVLSGDKGDRISNYDIYNWDCPFYRQRINVEYNFSHVTVWSAEA